MYHSLNSGSRKITSNKWAKSHSTSTKRNCPNNSALKISKKLPPHPPPKTSSKSTFSTPSTSSSKIDKPSKASNKPKSDSESYSPYGFSWPSFILPPVKFIRFKVSAHNMRLAKCLSDAIQATNCRMMEKDVISRPALLSRFKVFASSKYKL